MNVTSKVDLRSSLKPARDQGCRPTCSAFAVSAAHEFSRKTCGYLSPEYLFYTAVQLSHGDPTQGVSRNSMQEALANEGQPDENVWPYLSTIDLRSWRPPASLIAYKANLRLAKRTAEEVRAAVVGGRPVMLFMNITDALYTPSAQAVVRKMDSDRFTARHAMLAVGCGSADDGQYVLVRNSWGLEWGEQGHAWLHDNYVDHCLELSGVLERKD